MKDSSVAERPPPDSGDVQWTLLIAVLVKVLDDATWFSSVSDALPSLSRSSMPECVVESSGSTSLLFRPLPSIPNLLTA
ncbi:unnamed protein product [Sphagnum jensenii]|uniref:Uncharacterized protein n=1 Tax=Sphagnum jensenii TaxID=128206 RepID=A0ABP1B054_9BRYO